MSSIREQLAHWLALARTRVATAAVRVLRPRARRSQGASQPPIAWHAHDLNERLARRANRSQRERQPGSASGGRAVWQRYGARFYAAIGALGGSTLAQERGPEYMHDIGSRGGAATRQRYGREHYAEIGRKGGLAGRGSRRPRKRPGQLELGLETVQRAGKDSSLRSE